MNSSGDGYGGESHTFAPGQVSIVRSGTVTWSNSTGVLHNVTFSSASAPASIENFLDGNRSRQFPNAGTWLAAPSAEVGLAIAREAHPDLILMDIQLPGIDGLEATALLKADETTRGIPVIALTALAMKGDEERILAAGCDGYIAKPLDYKDFLAVVKATLVALV